MKRKRCGLLVVCAVVLVTSQAGWAGFVQWNTAEGGNGHLYEVVVSTSAISWDDAQAAAVATGGYLATITSDAENNFVFNLTSSTSGAWTHPAEWAEGPWLGGYQDRTAPDYISTDATTGWRWVTREGWDYTHWFDGQPDNWNSTEKYLCFWGMWPTEPGQVLTPTWNDAFYPQTAIHSYVIEAVPLPGSVLLGVWAVGLVSWRLRRHTD